METIVDADWCKELVEGVTSEEDNALSLLSANIAEASAFFNKESFNGDICRFLSDDESE